MKILLPFLALCAMAFASRSAAREINLVQNPGFETASGKPAQPDQYTLSGAAFYGLLGGAIDFANHPHMVLCVTSYGPTR